MYAWSEKFLEAKLQLLFDNPILRSLKTNNRHNDIGIFTILIPSFPTAMYRL